MFLFLIKRYYLFCFLFVVFLFNCPSFVFAHRADYIDETLVYLTVEDGGLEPEYWFDFGHSTDTGLDFIRHNLSLEYGFTDHLMVEARGTLRSPSREQTTFDSTRLETRYRFFEEGEKLIDFAVSGEINTTRLPNGTDQLGIEPRLILSKDIEALNLTLNLSTEIPVVSAAAEFNTSFGIRYNTRSFFNLGSELKYDMTTHEGSVVPQAWIKLPEHMTFKLAYSQPIDLNQESFWRFVFEVEFQTGPSHPEEEKKDDD